MKISSSIITAVFAAAVTVAFTGCAVTPPASKHGRLVQAYWVLPTGFTDSIVADAHNPKLQHHCVYENGVVLNIGRDPHCPR